MHKYKKLRMFQYIVWLPSILVGAAIFYFSSQPADVSTEMSDGVTTLLLHGAEQLGVLELSPALITSLCEKLAFPVRKSAHILEYMILHGTILFALFFQNETMRGTRWLKWAFIMTVCYAASDEFHQLFVPGRAGMVRDVVIDSLGVAGVTWILWRRKEEK